ncbi:hypothetical protein SGPA1_70103 [Streptomyces misionensis JCM 4497]
MPPDVRHGRPRRAPRPVLRRAPTGFAQETLVFGCPSYVTMALPTVTAGPAGGRARGGAAAPGRWLTRWRRWWVDWNINSNK